MTLSKKTLPSAITVDGIFYEVHTDHYYWLNFAELLKDHKARFSDFDFMYIADIPADKKAGFHALYDFYLCKTELPRADKTDAPDDTIPFDFKTDAELIYSAFVDCYGIDLFETPLHWQKFKALLNCLHDTKFNKVIEYRLWKKPSKNDTHDNYMAKMRRIWKIETEADKKAEEQLKAFSNLLKPHTKN